MNLPEMRQGHLETGGGWGREDPRSLQDKQKNPRGESKLGKRRHSFRLQTFDDEIDAKGNASSYSRCAKHKSVIGLFVQGQNVWQEMREVRGNRNREEETHNNK